MASIDKVQVIIEYIHRDMMNGEFWLDFRVDGAPYGSMGPFATEEERQRYHDKLMQMMRSQGARDIPMKAQ